MRAVVNPWQLDSADAEDEDRAHAEIGSSSAARNQKTRFDSLHTP